MTATVESPFGAQRMVHGFVLNNQLTDFSFLPTINGRPVANAVAPGKAPRSSMSPDDHHRSRGRLVLVAWLARRLIDHRLRRPRHHRHSGLEHDATRRDRTGQCGRAFSAGDGGGHAYACRRAR